MMAVQNWFVSNEGQCIEAEVVYQDEPLSRPYRLYRFLTDLERDCWR